MARNLKRSKLASARSEADIILTASEIASYAFCPAAWHNQRVGATRTADSIVNLERGTLAHRRIATGAMRSRWLERMRMLVLLLMIALAFGILAQVIRAGSVLRP
jgi:hypothetical protein